MEWRDAMRVNGGRKLRNTVYSETLETHWCHYIVESGVEVPWKALNSDSGRCKRPYDRRSFKVTGSRITPTWSSNWIKITRDCTSACVSFLVYHRSSNNRNAHPLFDRRNLDVHYGAIQKPKFVSAKMVVTIQAWLYGDVAYKLGNKPVIIIRSRTIPEVCVMVVHRTSHHGAGQGGVACWYTPLSDLDLFFCTSRDLYPFFRFRFRRRIHSPQEAVKRRRLLSWTEQGASRPVTYYIRRLCVCKWSRLPRDLLQVPE
ncbi:hypothetical protein CLF_103430 [Clonorchis sinensis]|uniref:Uncharacterized protein n=1 Tax=Clonorchis sinensis TaxID=79923 RepID=G7Y9Q5_CLOSI|nr:hypothetical protein CLF_103430 [Clonorchis sinensis]